MLGIICNVTAMLLGHAHIRQPGLPAHSRFCIAATLYTRLFERIGKSFLWRTGFQVRYVLSTAPGRVTALGGLFIAGLLDSAQPLARFPYGEGTFMGRLLRLSGSHVPADAVAGLGLPGGPVRSVPCHAGRRLGSCTATVYGGRAISGSVALHLRATVWMAPCTHSLTQNKNKKKKKKQ